MDNDQWLYEYFNDWDRAETIGETKSEGILLDLIDFIFQNIRTIVKVKSTREIFQAIITITT